MKVSEKVLRGLALLGLAGGLSGCLVAGYTSGSGFWVWPGTIVITAVLLLLFLLTRHR